MLTTPTIKIFYEAGKHVVLKAKGVAALILATGFGAAAVCAECKINLGRSHSQHWGPSTDSSLVNLTSSESAGISRA